MVFWLWQMKKSNIQCDYKSVLLLQSKYNTQLIGLQGREGQCLTRQ